MLSKSNSQNIDPIINQLKSFIDSRKSNLQQPYGVRTFPSGKGVMFTVNNIPDPLQNIIAKYISIITN